MKIIELEIRLNDLPNCYRRIKMTDISPVSKLAYVIMASFNTAMYHLYSINHDNISYQAFVDEDIPQLKSPTVKATDFRMLDLNIKKNDTFSMYYDFGTTHEFNIKVLNILDFPEDDFLYQVDYPYITEGYGKGIAEDVPEFMLMELLETKESFESLNINGYEYYNFDDYDIDEDNAFLHDRLYKASVAYEESLPF